MLYEHRRIERGHVRTFDTQYHSSGEKNCSHCCMYIRVVDVTLQ